MKAKKITGPVKIALDFPIKIDGKDITELTLVRPKVRDLVDAQGLELAQAEAEVHLIAKLTGINPEDIMEMDAGDYTRCQNELKSFLS